MKKNMLGVFVIMATLIMLALGAGCGGSCTEDDSRACTTTYTSCTSSCNPLSADYKACTDKCVKSYCDCLDDAGCETSASGGTCN